MSAPKNQIAVTVEEYLKQASLRVNAALERHLPPESDAPADLHKAVRYSIFAGGKRLRPALALASFEACHGTGEAVLLAACALEMTHTFSLIHDDLPCMDNDDFRRGRPTNHKVFGEAIAILAGDSLLVYAFELLAKTGKPECIATLARALGTKGMLGGQVVDIQSEGKKVGLETVNYIHNHKTAALLEASLVMGAQLAGADDEVIAGLGAFGNGIGLAFQIVDDVLDLEQTTEALGKDAGSDLAKGKATYPAVIGIPASKERARQLIEEAKLELRKLPIQGSTLELIADYIITRVH
ncbi:MAG: polyprenyl synthetase family protein [Fibrobacteres bacterium]|jgi:geranylgeranyl diphosphate synthase type II|nr:polyprenyl synthetase family protein [Fibrobacterota bacterium]